MQIILIKAASQWLAALIRIKGETDVYTLKRKKSNYKTQYSKIMAVQSTS